MTTDSTTRSFLGLLSLNELNSRTSESYLVRLRLTNTRRDLGLEMLRLKAVKASPNVLCRGLNRQDSPFQGFTQARKVNVKVLKCYLQCTKEVKIPIGVKTWAIFLPKMQVIDVGLKKMRLPILSHRIKATINLRFLETWLKITLKL